MIARKWLKFALLIFASASQSSLAQSPAATTIDVSLPADAQLWVNGRLTTSTGDRRVFRDSQAQPGSAYHYELRAVVNRDGQQVSKQRHVRLVAGDSTHVAFEFPQSTTTLKPTQPNEFLLVQDEFLLVQDNSLRRNQFQQPSTDTELQETPATGTQSGDRFRLRQPELGQPELGQPADLSQPSDTGAAPPTQPDLDLSNPTDSGRFGRQYGDEPDPTLGGQDAATDDLGPPLGTSDLPPPAASNDETRWKMQAAAPSDLEEYDAGVGAEGGAAKAAAPKADLSPWLAFICGNEQHHLTGNTGTVLHIWHHRWRMVRLQRAPNLGPFLVYDEVGHPGNQWAYGPRDACGQSPVYFKYGPKGRWHFVGTFKRVRPFTN